jgi:CHAD domain-containing protein
MAVWQQRLQQSEEAAARSVVRHELAVWVQAHRRITRRQTAAALHDFRVSLRRLRSALRAFRSVLGLPPGLRRRLRRLWRATNQSRNLAIWQAWLLEQAKQVGPGQQAGLRWLLTQLRGERRRRDARMQARVAKRFGPLRRELVEVSSARRSGAAPRRKGVRGADDAVRSALEKELAELRRQLKRVRSMRDREAAHAARIALKRVRYLLEPFASELPGGPDLVLRIARLQDLLGEVHDVHGFADELRGALVKSGEARSARLGTELLPWPGANRAGGRGPPVKAQVGLLALARRLRREGEARFRRLRAEQRSGGIARLLKELAELAAEKQ